MNLISVGSLVVNCVAGALALLVAFAPYAATVETTAGGSTTSESVGLLLVESGGSFVVSTDVCTSSFDDCTELQVLIMLYFVALVLGGAAYVGNGVCCVSKPGLVFALSPVAFALVSLPCFGYFARVVPLIRDSKRGVANVTAIDWSLDWVGYVAIVAVVVGMAASLVTTVLSPTLQKRASAPKAGKP